ncbi:hypothetical protein B9Z55_002749 [Caenorhabditis nigoni]|nr:hypothetical protein B9Z55_002749 [Caenorhabditis nigoni]
MDGIITESAEPYNLINYEEKENSDGCKTANVTCSVAEGWDCAVVEVMGTFDGQVVYIISDKSSENFASSSLTCRHDGQYNYLGLNPTSVWCNTTSCTPKPTEPSENKCNACTMDGILKEDSEPYKLINYEEKENSDGCKTANVTCSVAEGWDCDIVEVMGTVGQVVYKISDQSSENFASSSLTCSDVGHYTSFGLQPTDVWCNTHTCTPKPTQPSEKKCSTCSMDGIIRDMGVEVIFVNYEEYENSNGCKIANITCSVADGWNCSDLSVKAFSGAAVNDITRQYIQNFAGSFLTCTDDGQYTILDLSPTLVWCDSPICTPKPA